MKLREKNTYFYLRRNYNESLLIKIKNIFNLYRYNVFKQFYKKYGKNEFDILKIKIILQDVERTK